jgi:hypothetical protein
MAPTQMMIVAGAAATVADLGKDESWLKDWLAEEPARLGLGDVTILAGEPVQGEDGNPAFIASDAARYYSVNVKLGELDASHGFHVLDSWARNRVRHPDKTHVAVLVTESLGDRYETALKALSEHLPLVVVELAAWRGKTEILVVPRIALASDDLRLGKPADASPTTQPASERPASIADAARPGLSTGAARPLVADKPEPGGQDQKTAEEVSDPWKLPKRDAAPAGVNGATQPQG